MPFTFTTRRVVLALAVAGIVAFSMTGVVGQRRHHLDEILFRTHLVSTSLVYVHSVERLPACFRPLVGSGTRHQVTWTHMTQLHRSFQKSAPT